MKYRHPAIPDDFDDPPGPAGEAEETPEEDLWFLPPGPIDADPDELPPGPRAEPGEGAVLAEWRQAEASLAARLARVAGRFGALDERLRRGPEGWRHRLALMEAADLSWFAGHRVSLDRLSLWVSMRLSGVQEDTGALSQVGWAARRLTGGPGPEAGLAGFLGRHDPDGTDGERIAERAESWSALMAAAADLHPISRACMGFHLWALAGLGPQGDRMEAAVTAARAAAGEGRGAAFAPLAMGGAGGLRAGGAPSERLARWCEGMDSACLAALRHLEGIEAWSARAQTLMAPLSGRTPPMLRAALDEWPLLSAPMAQTLTGASRATVQRNLTWMETHGLIREVTGQERFRMWKAVV
ncbi:MAG: hypothetical protein ACK5JR_09525 [Tropicimonas sp.]|uniref:hypothetical protein n=1 Tax=Tropicimonas sp. TaxID=2067044 RepID=UPI003A8C4B52